MAESRVVAILREHGGWMPAAELRTAYCANGASKGTAFNAVSAALDAGFIERRGSRRWAQYRVSARAPKHVVDRRDTTLRTPRVPTVQEKPAMPYAGPAFDRGAQLAASVGVQCGDPEVMPAEVANIIDGLHRSFFEQFRNVE